MLREHRAHIGVLSFDTLLTEMGYLGSTGKVWFVDGTNGSDTYSGKSWKRAFKTIAKAFTKVAARDIVKIAPGAYAEALTQSVADVAVLGMGSRGSVFVEPATAADVALTWTADEGFLFNVECWGEATGTGLDLQANYFNAIGSKFASGPTGTHTGKGLSINGNIADGWFRDCEICWADKGIIFERNGGANSQFRFDHSRLHNITTDVVTDEDNGDITIADLEMINCEFANKEDATAPTFYINLDGAGNTGLIRNCAFAAATITAAKMAIPAGILWVANEAEDGVSSARPA